MKNKWVAVLLAFFLGGLGIHRFYVGDTKWGIILLLTCWTGIPAIVGLIDAIRWALMDEQEFHVRYSPAVKYGNGSGPTTVVGLLLAASLLFGGTALAQSPNPAVCRELARLCVMSNVIGLQRPSQCAVVLETTYASAAQLPPTLRSLFSYAMTSCCLAGSRGEVLTYDQVYRSCMR